MLRSVITCTKPVLPYLRMFRTGYTYVATYVCKALYDNAQIHINCNFLLIPLRRMCMQCAHYEKRDSR